MATHRLIGSSSWLTRRLSSRCCSLLHSVRYLSNDKDDPFGVHFEDGNDGLGPRLPPKYVRDRATGKMTGDVVQELTDEQQHILNLEDIEKDRRLMDQLVDQWDKDESHQNQVADRIRQEDMALNTLGRRATNSTNAFSQPLSPQEFNSLSRFLKNQHNVQIDESDIPVQEHHSNDDDDDDDTGHLEWLTAAAQREMSDDAFLDIMPSDLNPARLVNRKKAKRIPKQLLHHNNLSLLRRYVTPGGQIMNRVQSRLGAKDQRKVAKLVKRARALGLIPYIGQWKYENHGNMYEEDMHEEKDWEKEIHKRGLVKGKKDT